MKKLILILVSLAFVFSGCKSDTAPEECVEMTNQFVEYFKEKDFESMYAMTKYQDPYLAGTYNEDSEISQTLFNAMSENLNFEITGGTRNGSDAYVNAHIVTIDFKTLMTDVVSEYTEFCIEKGDEMTSDELGDALLSILRENLENAVPYEKDTSLDFVKEKGKWIIDDNVGVYDDLSGGYLTYCFGLNQAGISGVTEN